MRSPVSRSTKLALSVNGNSSSRRSKTWNTMRSFPLPRRYASASTTARGSSLEPGRVGGARAGTRALSGFADGPGASQGTAVLHRRRAVDEDGEVRVRVRLELLHEMPVAAREQLPIDAPDVVAGHVRAMLGEIHRRAEVRRTVQAVDDALDDDARHKPEIADSRQDGGIDESSRSCRLEGSHLR